MKILTTELLPDFEYFPESRKKIQLVLHHTVSQVGKYVDDWFKADKGKSRIAVAYVIDKNGDIFQLFEDPSYWAYHIGKGSTTMQNKKSIGIEIVNEGQLFKRSDGNFYWWIDKDYPEGRYEYTGGVFELDDEWRKEKYFATYTEEQVKALKELTEQILLKFPLIKRRVLCNFNYNPDNANYNGILMHCNLREDKFDLSPAFNIEDFTEFVSAFAINEVARKLTPKQVEWVKYNKPKQPKVKKEKNDGDKIS